MEIITHFVNVKRAGKARQGSYLLKSLLKATSIGNKSHIRAFTGLAPAPMEHPPKSLEIKSSSPPPIPTPPPPPPEVLKVAVHVLLAFIVMVHVVLFPQLAQSPLQPPKVEPEAGAAVSVTDVPELYASEQSAPQFIPPSLLVTVPEPVPDLVMVRVYCC